MLFRSKYTAYECAQCGERLFMPEWSEYLDQRSVRHLWKCERCDYEFETTASYSTAAA
jgi:DNA-directed RNA polymerase subunit RPC12/RpoP